MATVIPLPVKLRAPSPERAAELFKAADQLWPEYEAERKAEEREKSTPDGSAVDFCRPSLRVVR